MALLLWLTILQALVIEAAPRPRQGDCNGNALHTPAAFLNGLGALGALSAQPDGASIVINSRVAEILATGSNRNANRAASFSTSGVVGISIASVAVVSTSVTPSVSVIFTSTMSGSVSGTAQVLPSPTESPATHGVIITALNTTGQATQGPLIQTTISKPKTTISPTALKSSVFSIKPHMASQNIFQPVATNAPPNVIGSRGDHPVPRLGIKPQSSPISTNKFYANFFLGSQTAASWTHPYSVAWVKGGGQSGSWGMSISHLDANQKVFGPDPSANPAQYFINPIGIQSIILSASELGSSTIITMDSLTSFSANVNLLQNPGSNPAITFPLVQGMGFVTAIYHGQTPTIQSIVLIRSLTRVTTSPKPGVSKFTIILEDGKTWFIYAYSPSGFPLDFTVVNNGKAQATSGFDGIIQVAKNPTDGISAEAQYDAACGAFATGVTLSGSANGDVGSYTFTFQKGGMSNTTLLMFALPHHLASLSPSTANAVTSIHLSTTTKGLATALLADSWTMSESLPTSMGFAPWSPGIGNQFSTFSAATTKAIHSVASSEISQNMTAQTNLNSMYYSGKALHKFAQIAYALHSMLGDAPLALAGLSNLKEAFSLFTSNHQQYPLVYESAWGGIVSTASYSTGDSGVDFGNSYYNDHHFHYGYFILAASIIVYLDPSWLSVPGNKEYIDTLVRDIANPSPSDQYFPIYRNFDWYHGHSWAHGLYESFDGKDQESSSEDSMSAYALKMWGSITGDANLEARGNLQLAITARSLQSYFLYTSDNQIQPANFIQNKVSGILFENKIDHTTYFGARTEFVQGIHMLPLLPCSALTRTKQFVTEEWNRYFSNGRAEQVQGGWGGVLFANLALVDPKTSWGFFSNANFDAGLLDGGASRTWYLALSAAMGGAAS